MTEITGEPGPSDANKKIEDSVAAAYDKILQDEQATKAKAAQEQKEALEFYDRMRNLGFATAKDVEMVVEAKTQLIAEFQKAIEEVKKEQQALRDFLLRAKARSQLHSGALEPEKKQEESALKAWERPFFKDMKR